MKDKGLSSYDDHFWYFEQFREPRIFDTKDLEHINIRFSLEELKEELHTAELEEYTSRSFGESEREEYWRQFRGLVEYLYYGRLLIRKEESLTETGGEQSTIQKVKEANEIVETISNYIVLRKSGNRFYSNCPFHEDRNPSFYVYPDTQRWYCFGCNQNGDVIDFVKLIKGFDTSGAIRELSRG